MASQAQLAALAKARAARKKKAPAKIAVGAKSRVTKKAPSKRLKARCAKLKKYAPLIGIAVIAWVFRNQIASTFRDKK